MNKIGFLNYNEIQKIEEQNIFPAENELIFAQNKYANIDSFQTKRNNNILICGASGSGKTRNIISPNILQANTSYIIYDPKGKLYKDYSLYLLNRGYEIFNFDFLKFQNTSSYNPFTFINTEQDIISLADIIISRDKTAKSYDPYWDDNATLLLISLISYMLEVYKKENQNFNTLNNLLCKCYKECEGDVVEFDNKMRQLKEINPSSFAVQNWAKLKRIPMKTMNCVVSTAISRVGLYDNKEINRMLSKPSIDFRIAAQKKAAFFVTVSDVDRSMDTLANLFFTHAFRELITYADRECENECLPVPVQFILDDFGTAIKLNNFDKIIATIRSRNISAIICIQSENQLYSFYKTNGDTIIINCDTYIYLTSNSSNNPGITARVHLNTSNMKLDDCIIARRGEEPCIAKLFDIDTFKKMKMTDADKVKEENKLNEKEGDIEKEITKPIAIPKKKIRKDDTNMNYNNHYCYSFLSRYFYIEQNIIDNFEKKTGQLFSMLDITHFLERHNIVCPDIYLLTMTNEELNDFLKENNFA